MMAMALTAAEIVRLIKARDDAHKAVRKMKRAAARLEERLAR